MKAHESLSGPSKLSRKARTVLTDERLKFEPLRKWLAATVRRLLNTGERLRATLDDETD